MKFNILKITHIAISSKWIKIWKPVMGLKCILDLGYWSLRRI